MSIFTEMHELRTFTSLADYKELLRRVDYALQKGWIEEVPVTIKRPVPWDERWFKDKESGEVYLLEVPEPPATGTWRAVEPEERFPNQTVGSGGAGRLVN